MEYKSCLTIKFIVRKSTKSKRVLSFLGAKTVDAVHSICVVLVMLSVRTISILVFSNSRGLGSGRYGAEFLESYLSEAAQCVLHSADATKAAISKESKFWNFVDEWFLVSMIVRGYLQFIYYNFSLTERWHTIFGKPVCQSATCYPNEVYGVRLQLCCARCLVSVALYFEWFIRLLRREQNCCRLLRYDAHFGSTHWRFMMGRRCGIHRKLEVPWHTPSLCVWAEASLSRKH